MRASVGLLVVAVTACGGGPRREVDRPAPVHAALESPAATDDQLGLLRALAADAVGSERLDVQRRLYLALLDHEDDRLRAEALAVIESIVASPDFAGWDGADTTLFDRATLLQRTDVRRARGAWQRLVDDYPASPLAPAAHLGLGELAFDDADLMEAERQYGAVIGSRDRGRNYSYARYKLGWVHLNLGASEQALADFVAVVREADGPLRTEALKDVVRAYADAGDPDQAIDFFDRLARGQGPAMGARLAALYRDRGEGLRAATAYRAAVPRLDVEAACAAGRELDELVRITLSREVADVRDALAPYFADCAPPSP